jgi:hypothetical protein
MAEPEEPPSLDAFIALNRLMEMAIRDFCRMILPLLCQDCRLHIPAAIRKEIEKPVIEVVEH